MKNDYSIEITVLRPVFQLIFHFPLIVSQLGYSITGKCSHTLQTMVSLCENCIEWAWTHYELWHISNEFISLSLSLLKTTYGCLFHHAQHAHVQNDHQHIFRVASIDAVSMAKGKVGFINSNVWVFVHFGRVSLRSSIHQFNEVKDRILEFQK